jgi:hypothetical protein
MTDFRTPTTTHSALLRLGVVSAADTSPLKRGVRSAAEPQALNQRLVAIWTSPP